MVYDSCIHVTVEKEWDGYEYLGEFKGFNSFSTMGSLRAFLVFIYLRLVGEWALGFTEWGLEMESRGLGIGSRR